MTAAGAGQGATPAATPPKALFPATVAVLLASTAAYFIGSAAAPTLAREWGLDASTTAALSWSAHAGFIAGTLLVAATNVADRVAPQRLVAALLVAAAGANVAFVFVEGDTTLALALRFAAGALAGPVYPVGMKLLASWYPRIGLQLGLLLAAYNVGASGAFLLRAVPDLAWEAGFVVTAVLALAAAVAALALSPGPLLPRASPFDVEAVPKAFRVPAFRRSALGYFGHMWELFPLWAAWPFWLAASGLPYAGALAAAGIAAGGVGCVVGGFWSRSVGEARVARVALAASALCCLASPFLFGAHPALLVPFVLVWGAAAVADSPMFSALSARAAPRDYVGTALTVQNSIGFAVAIAGTAVLVPLAEAVGWRWALLALAAGPVSGLVAVASGTPTSPTAHQRHEPPS